jgi:hypothetical protein
LQDDFCVEMSGTGSLSRIRAFYLKLYLMRFSSVSWLVHDND